MSNHNDYPQYGGDNNFGDNNANGQHPENFNTEGSNTGGYGDAGYNAGGQDTGGYNAGGYNSGGYGDAGYNAGGYEQYGGGYQAQPGGYPGGYAQQPESKNPVAPWALGVGIVSLIGSIFVFGAFLGIVGLVLSIVALVIGRKRRPENRRTGMSVAGLVTSILSFVVAIGLTIFAVGFFEELGVRECAEIHEGDDAAIQKCVEDRINEKIGQ